MSTLWFDVTTSLNWTRPAVGVVRVETECFKYLAGLHSPEIKFCRFDKADQLYREVEPPEVFAAIERHGHAPDAPKQTTPSRRVVDRARQAIDQMPSPLRAPMMNLGRRSEPLLRNTLHNIRKVRGAVKNVASHANLVLRSPESIERSDLTNTGARFRGGDVLVSAGLDWSEKDPLLIYRLKLGTGLKVVMLCYDLIPVLLPHLCVGEVAGIFSQYFVNVAWCADEVLCISRASQRDFLDLVHETGAPEPHTSILRLGANLPVSPERAPNVQELVTGKYLLFVSTVERRKNHEVLYRALTLLADRGRKDLPKIVFVGMVGWGVHDFLNDLRFDPRVRDRFVLLQNVTDAQLSQLYRNAEFTLYPSLYEGWGLPLAESLAHGKFCVASNSSSLPEVAGGFVEYLEPWETHRWAERIAHYLDHPEEVRQREAVIAEKYVPPKWEDTGRAVYEAAMSVISARLPQSPPAA